MNSKSAHMIWNFMFTIINAMDYKVGMSTIISIPSAQKLLMKHISILREKYTFTTSFVVSQASLFSLYA